MSLTVGYPSITGRSQDGYISSLLVFLLLVSVTTGLSVVRGDVTGGYIPQVALLCVNLCMTVATVLMLVTRVSSAQSICDMYAQPEQETYEPRVRREWTRSRRLQLSRDISAFLQKAVPLVGLVSFYILGSFEDILAILSYGYCMPTFCHCGPETAFYYVITLMSHLVRLCFMGGAMLFCVYFHNKVFVRCVASRYVLMFIMLGALSVWFTTVLFQTTHTVTPPPGEVIRRDCPAPPGNHSNMVSHWQCLYLNTSLFFAMSDASTYLTPMTIQFLLIVAQMVITLFFGALGKDERRVLDDVFGDADRGLEAFLAQSRDHPDCCSVALVHDPDGESLPRSGTTGQQEGTRNENDSGSVTQVILEPCSNGEAHDSDSPLACAARPRDVRPKQTRRRPRDAVLYPDHVTDELTNELKTMLLSLAKDLRPLADKPVSPQGGQREVRAGDEAENRHLDDPEARGRHGNRPGSYLATGYERSLTSPVLFPALLLNLLYITLSCMVYLGKHKKHSTMVDFYFSFKIIYRIIFIVVCLAGFAYARSLKVCKNEIGGLEKMLIFSSTGVSLIFFLAAIADMDKVIQPGGDMTPLRAITGRGLNLIDVYLQMAFLCLGSRMTDAGRQSQDQFRFRMVNLYLALSNFTLWIIDSFLVYNAYSVLGSVEREFYGGQNWTAMCLLFRPFTLFLRFNSAIVFLQIYLEL